jgi:hypothetical protein
MTDNRKPARRDDAYQAAVTLNSQPLVKGCQNLAVFGSNSLNLLANYLAIVSGVYYFRHISLLGFYLP